MTQTREIKKKRVSSNDDSSTAKKSHFGRYSKHNKCFNSFSFIIAVMIIFVIFIFHGRNHHFSPTNTGLINQNIAANVPIPLQPCNMLVAHGPDPWAGYATLIYLYPINFLLLSERRGMKLWIDFNKDYNDVCYDANMGSENVWNYYLQPIDPQSQHCDMNSSTFEVLSKAFNDELHRRKDWAVHAWYYHEYETMDNNVYYDEWYFKQRSNGYKMVQKYFTFKDEIVQNVQNQWNQMFESSENEFEVLGVHMRGTDKAAGRRKVSAEKYIEYMQQFIAYFGKKRARIFVATDDKNYLLAVQKNIDENLWFMQKNVIRSNTSTAVFAMENVSKYELGINVLSDILLLSKCDWFIHSASAVAEAVFYNNLELHNKSVHLECTKNRQIPVWFKAN